GRKRQMIKFKGTTLYPPALFDLLNEMEDILDYVVEVYSNEVGLDEVQLYLQPAGLTEASDHRVRAYLQARLRVSPHIVYVSAEEIHKMHFSGSGRKAVKFVDKRN
ncbi:MAG: phenylacetate--CoA ligase family protein, partial [Bacteroidota bacterium]|nr:phenylacetate--CoA ligase family protein [Bacteroidota bacterium]